MSLVGKEEVESVILMAYCCLERYTGKSLPEGCDQGRNVSHIMGWLALMAHDLTRTILRQIEGSTVRRTWDVGVDGAVCSCRGDAEERGGDMNSHERPNEPHPSSITGS